VRFPTGYGHDTDHVPRRTGLTINSGRQLTTQKLQLGSPFAFGEWVMATVEPLRRSPVTTWVADRCRIPFESQKLSYRSVNEPTRRKLPVRSTVALSPLLLLFGARRSRSPSSPLFSIDGYQNRTVGNLRAGGSLTRVWIRSLIVAFLR